MRRQRAPVAIFSLAFLDIISCAFGAVVMLILLANNGDDGTFNDSSQITTIIQAITSAKSSIGELRQAQSDKLEQLKQMQADSASNRDNADALTADIARAKNNVQQLTDAASGLEQTMIERERAATQEGNAKERDAEVGGIPVDSEYVIFIIDTSGSMGRIWQNVLQTVSEVLNNHPRVKGFQVMSDNGVYLLSATKGRWRKDTPQQRASVLKAMRSWSASSSSSPLEGIEVALRTYAQKTDSLALYIFGDDYTGGSYDKSVARVNQLNTNKRTGKKVARIHGIGFISGNRPIAKFSTFMREVARQNNGTFMALAK
ncbi:Secreted protein, containing von Willebrand factor (VWF) type A domain [hydrothermal vent metagenome]|uniref:Secreted protein, containing von Willebrand factor (VWF) type A domain n=1 Tax=hydrothermal vent metagenome TaxID=652676 RepID=A0A3B1BP49_9ZZZZ